MGDKVSGFDAEGREVTGWRRWLQALSCAGRRRLSAGKAVEVQPAPAEDGPLHSWELDLLLAFDRPRRLEAVADALKSHVWPRPVEELLQTVVDRGWLVRASRQDVMAGLFTATELRLLAKCLKVKPFGRKLLLAERLLAVRPDMLSSSISEESHWRLTAELYDMLHGPTVRVGCVLYRRWPSRG